MSNLGFKPGRWECEVCGWWIHGSAEESSQWCDDGGRHALTHMQPVPPPIPAASPYGVPKPPHGIVKW